MLLDMRGSKDKTFAAAWGATQEEDSPETSGESSVVLSQLAARLGFVDVDVAAL